MRTLFILFILATAAACQNNSDTSSKALTVATSIDTVTYSCPMNCQGDTAYTTEGKCPVCEMDLVKN